MVASKHAGTYPIMWWVIAVCLVVAAQPVMAEGFSSVFTMDESSLEPDGFDLAGTAGFAFSYGFEAKGDSRVTALPALDLDLSWSNGENEVFAGLTLEPHAMDDTLQWDEVIDQLYLRRYFPWGRMEGGLMKREWGKGDGAHVVDPLNAMDQRYGILPDLNEMKIAEMMASIQVQKGDSALELVYKPFFQPMRLSLTGDWAVVDASMASLIDADSVPDTHTLAYSQFAAHARTIWGPADIGLIYYYGFLNQPGYEILAVDPVTYYPTSVGLRYTQAQLFGGEAALAVGPFTIMLEGGFWLSEDSAGTEPSLYNHKFVYLAGFDFTVPKTALFVSFLWNGQYILGFDGLSAFDVDSLQSYDGKAHADTLILTLQLPLVDQRLETRLTGMYQLESSGYLIIGACTWTPDDDLSLELSVNLYGAAQGDTAPQSVFKRWMDNDSASIKLNYRF